MIGLGSDKKESSCKCRKAPAEQSAAAAETRPDSGGRNTGFLKFLIGTSSNRDFLTMSTIFIRINDILYKMAVAAHCDFYQMLHVFLIARVASNNIGATFTF